MYDSRKGLADKTKRELVDLLLTEVEQWPGDAPMGEESRVRADALLAALYTCRLWLSETHWHSLCRLWLVRSARPDPWLRTTWRETLLHWQRFLADVGYEADSRPFVPPVPHPPRAPYIPEPGHLPPGFVKSLTG